MARPKAADHDEQRQRILGQAVRAFARVGYASASMSGLASACRTSKATLYHYFPNKEALLFEALERYTSQLLALVERVTRTEPAGEVRLRALVRALMREYQHAHDFHVCLLQNVKFLGEPQAETIRAQERRIVECFAAAIEQTRPQAMPAPRRKALAMGLLGSLNFTFAWLQPDGVMGPEEYADMIVEVWLHGLPAGQARSPGTSGGGTQ